MNGGGVTVGVAQMFDHLLATVLWSVTASFIGLSSFEGALVSQFFLVSCSSRKK